MEKVEIRFDAARMPDGLFEDDAVSSFRERENC